MLVSASLFIYGNPQISGAGELVTVTATNHDEVVEVSSHLKQRKDGLVKKPMQIQ